MDKIRVLYIGKNNIDISLLPKYVELEVVNEVLGLSNKQYEITIIDKMIKDAELSLLFSVSKTSATFYTDNLSIDATIEEFIKKKKAKLIDEDIIDFINRDSRFFFAYSYGEKYQLKKLEIVKNLNAKVRFYGNYAVNLDLDLGDDFVQVAYWKNNIPIGGYSSLDYWLEYKKTDGIEIKLKIVKLYRGSLDEIAEVIYVSNEQIDDIFNISSDEKEYNIQISIYAKGKGTLDIIALHNRHSRGKYGHLIPGGERKITSNKEEIFSYFDPGTKKGPLCVYFSGYKTLESFEGYYMMKTLEMPFLLFSECRLEGGNFYIGTDEYAKLISDTINETLEYLGLTNKDLILSGISMGSFGALYYASKLLPKVVLVGKPLVNIGTIAMNEKSIRPNFFPTSLDAFKYQREINKLNDYEEVNNLFWKSFEQSDFSDTRFVVSYMLNDDYDPHAYDELIDHFTDFGVQIYGKGFIGRHNDNTSGIVSWFLSQYNYLLLNVFGVKKSDW